MKRLLKLKIVLIFEVIVLAAAFILYLYQRNNCQIVSPPMDFVIPIFNAFVTGKC